MMTLEPLNYVLHYGPQVCTRMIPDSMYKTLNSALVCGVELSDRRPLQIFADCGLLPLLLLAGAHFVFLERLCMRLAPPRRLLLLACYCWLTGFGAPVLRALARRCSALGLRRWGWTTLQIEALVTVGLLALYPPWLFSRSFWASWLCALALRTPWSWPWEAPGRWRWPPSLKIYLFLFPFYPNSPLVVVWNVLVSPVLGTIFFPLAWLCVLCPPLVWFSDIAWRLLLAVISAGPQASPTALRWSPTWVWWVPLLLHSLFIYGEWKWRRAVAFLYSP